MGFFRSLVRLTQASVKEGQKAAAAHERAVATAGRAQAAQERAAEATATLDAARGASPYFRDASAPPGSRVATLEPWPEAPEGDDASLERWERKVVATDRRLGLWTGEYDSNIGRTHDHREAWAWVTEGAEEALDGANIVIELRWVRDYVEGGYPADQPIDAYTGPVLVGSLVEDGLEATLKRRRSSGKPTFVRGVLSHSGGRRKADWTVWLPGIPEPAE
jgi:hypothetical protein